MCPRARSGCRCWTATSTARPIPASMSTIARARTGWTWSARSKQLHTAHQHPVEARIHYPFHPRHGEIVLVTKQYTFRGAGLVVIPQPDGSVACIPAWMTDESAARHQLRAEARIPLQVLRCLRAEVDELLRFLHPESRMEKAANETQERKYSAGVVLPGRAARRRDRLADGAAGKAGRSTAAGD